LCSNPFVDKSTQIELPYPSMRSLSLSLLRFSLLKFKDYIECTLKIFQSDFPRSQIR